MNKHTADGFRDEMTKMAVSFEDGAMGLGVGAVVGAALSAVGTDVLQRLIANNKNLAIITGAIMGAGALGSAGFLLGKGGTTVTNVTEAPPANGVFHGPPPAGTPISSMRHI